MPLREEFSEAIRLAETRREKGYDPLAIRLHQAIVGERHSGKNYLAQQYIRELQARKLVSDTMVEFHYPGRYLHDILGEAPRAKGGILLIDEMYHLGDDNYTKSILSDIAHVMLKNECTVVMLGTEKVLGELIKNSYGLMNRPVIITPEGPEALQHPITVKKNPFALRPRGRKADNA